MGKKLPESGTTPDPQSEATRNALAQHRETIDLRTELQRAALRLSELGHMKAGADVLRAAVRLTRTKPGRHA